MKRLLIALLAVLLVMAGVWAVIDLVGRGEPAFAPGGGTPSPPAIVDAGGTALRFPGDLLALGATQGGGWLAVYQRSEDGAPAIYARESRDLLGRFGPEVAVSNPADGPGYDPGAVTLGDGSVIVTWSSRSAVWYAARVGPGRFGPPGPLFSDPGGRQQEQTVARVAGRSFIVYNFHPVGGPYVWDIRIRELFAGPAVGPPVTIAPKATGLGTEGGQKRVTLASTGRPGELLAVWSERTIPAGGPRPIEGATSADGGATWEPPRRIAVFALHDLLNPYVVLAGPNDLRVYFTQHAHTPGLGFVRSTDGGRTWGAREDVVGLPPGFGAVRVVIVADPAHGLIAFSATPSLRVLTTYLVDPLRRPQSSAGVVVP